MATYDPVAQRMAVRVVYDGVACAGKTTNLRQLCALFAAQRSSELYSPADIDGRTLYFDWMQIMAGVVCGFPLLCQIVSVPGQVVLTPRRRHLLATADVIVYVCESTAAAAPASKAGLALYDELALERGSAVPLVVQANKQDQRGALDGATLLRAIGREGTPVVEAIASDGVGVVDTFVGAVRTVARAIQARSEKDVLRVSVRRAETAAETLARISEARTDPEWAAEMLLEEAQAAFLLEQTARSLTVEAADRAAAAAAARDLTETADRPAWVAASTAAVTDTRVLARPAPPSAEVPTGFIWPAHTGRATLRSLALRAAPPGAFDVDGVLVSTAQGHVARTSTRAQYANGEAAREALVRKARECTQLDRLLVPETVLVAQPASDGACWIWTVRPELPTVARLLRAGDARRDLLEGYGAAVVEVLRASLRHGFSSELTPNAFGLQQGDMRYVGDHASDSPSATSLSVSIFSAVDAVAEADADVGAFLDAFERALQRRLTPEERVRATGGISGASNAKIGASRDAGDRMRAVLTRAAGVA